ncbi:hypothetical protein GGI17_003237 [Coemansia sp. S146]|nr:hypothetical protein GGI17_003237 [Coemansia sp. S146]
MSTLSLFQLLPLHIVRLIVNNVTGSSRMVFDGVRVGSHEYMVLLKPLLWVCHNFRAVAYSRYCNNFELNLTSMSLNDLDPRYLRTRRADIDYRMLNYLGYSTHHSAKDVTVFLDERTVYSGEALAMVSRAPYDGCTFPLARKIAFTFSKEKKDVMNDPLLVGANIVTFVERIKQMVPLVGEISVLLVDCDDMPSIADQHFGDLASRLYQLAYRVEYSYILDVVDSMRLQLDMIHNLTYLSYNSDSSIGDAYQFVQLSQRNALTLQSLILECEHDIDILGLVQDAGGNHVTYPHLLTLKLWATSDTDEPRQPQFRGAAPFPTLRRLCINLDSTFDDDIFFRGNAASLEWLDMTLDLLSVPMLRKFKVFVPGSHPKLQRVKLWYSENTLELFASPAEAMQFMYSIGSQAAVREYAKYNLQQDLLPMLSSFGSHSRMRILLLPSLRPELWQVITLIKSLPLLSDLQTSSPSLEPMPDGVTSDKLPEHMFTNYAPMGRRFRCWNLDIGYANICSELATCVLLLALACPNFDYAAVGKGHREFFMEQMEKVIASDYFKSYAPRLRRLLFYGWNVAYRLVVLILALSNTELLIPLLWVCHNFRTFVRERFCRVYELTLENDRDRAEAVLYSWPTHFEEFGYPTHLLAKELRVKLDIKSVFTGKVLQFLSDAPYEGRSFPLVHKLCFDLTSDEEGYYD